MFAPSHIIMVFLVALLVFGPEKMPEIARTIGRILKEFRRASAEVQHHVQSTLGDIGAERIPKVPDLREIVTPRAFAAAPARTEFAPPADSAAEARAAATPPVEVAPVAMPDAAPTADGAASEAIPELRGWAEGTAPTEPDGPGVAPATIPELAGRPFERGHADAV